MESTRVQAGGWYMALYDIHEDLSPQEQELLKGVYFDTTRINFGIVYSEQVEAFLSSMRRSGCISVLAPWFREILIEEDAKRQIREGNQTLLAQHKETLQKIAYMLDEKLAITKKSP